VDCLELIVKSGIKTPIYAYLKEKAMLYTIQYSGHIGSFRITDTSNQTIGQLTFESWMNSNANAELNTESVTFKKADFWGMRYAVMQNHQKIAIIKLTGMGYLKIEYDGQTYKLKYRGFMNYRYELQDESGTALMVLRPTFRWKTFKSDYSIDVVNPFLKIEKQQILMTLCGFGLAIKTRNGY